MVAFISISDNPDYDVNWKGDSEWLDDKFVRFSYRFKFEDNEYSLMAPFSQPMFIPKNYSEFGGAAWILSRMTWITLISQQYYPGLKITLTIYF